MGNESVSWIRVSDQHILTVDEDVFVSNPRISAIREQEREEEEEEREEDTWTLQIKYKLFFSKGEIPNMFTLSAVCAQT